MKKKTKILIVEPVILRLESPLPNDASLPKPRGTYLEAPCPNNAELLRLKLTKQFGGLLKERWRWHGGRAVFEDYIAAKEPTQKEVTVNTISDAKKQQLRAQIKKQIQ
jgi:hypothetical protein